MLEGGRTDRRVYVVTDDEVQLLREATLPHAVAGLIVDPASFAGAVEADRVAAAIISTKAATAELQARLRRLRAGGGPGLWSFGLPARESGLRAEPDRTSLARRRMGGGPRRAFACQFAFTRDPSAMQCRSVESRRVGQIAAGWVQSWTCRFDASYRGYL